MIKSMIVQNGVMLLSLGFVLFLVVRAIVKKKSNQALIFCMWVVIVLWFFNSPFFGFSAVTVSPHGIRLDYGVLSIRNTVVPLDASCKIVSTMSGIKKLRRLYFLEVDGHQSMKVRGKKGVEVLEAITGAVEQMKSRMNPERTKDAAKGVRTMGEGWKGTPPFPLSMFSPAVVGNAVLLDLVV